MFHPPADFIQKGGQEDLYMHEMRKIMEGVELGPDDQQEAPLDD